MSEGGRRVAGQLVKTLPRLAEEDLPGPVTGPKEGRSEGRTRRVERLAIHWRRDDRARAPDKYLAAHKHSSLVRVDAGLRPTDKRVMLFQKVWLQGERCKSPCPSQRFGKGYLARKLKADAVHPLVGRNEPDLVDVEAGAIAVDRVTEEVRGELAKGHK